MPFQPIISVIGLGYVGLTTAFTIPISLPAITQQHLELLPEVLL